MYCSYTPYCAQWRVYTLCGELVCSVTAYNGADALWDTSKVASGIYLIVAELTVKKGDQETQERFRKVAVLR
jgi:hypothetical protein